MDRIFLELLMERIEAGCFSKSPYSESYYIFMNEYKTVKWDYKPKDCIRISDHWNFESRGKYHCIIDELKEQTNINLNLICQYNDNGMYNIISNDKKLYNILIEKISEVISKRKKENEIKRKLQSEKRKIEKEKNILEKREKFYNEIKMNHYSTCKDKEKFLKLLELDKIYLYTEIRKNDYIRSYESKIFEDLEFLVDSYEKLNDSETKNVNFNYILISENEKNRIRKDLEVK